MSIPWRPSKEYAFGQPFLRGGMGRGRRGKEGQDLGSRITCGEAWGEDRILWMLSSEQGPPPPSPEPQPACASEGLSSE